MKDNKKSRFGGMGTGYITIIMLFAVISLTVLAVLSYQAASANDILNEKNSAFTLDYYEADSRAKAKLSVLDSASLAAMQSELNGGFFEDEFAASCDEIGEITLLKRADGFTVEFTEEINERLRLEVSVIFYRMPRDGARYSITQWKMSATDTENDSGHLGVWDGSTLN